MSLLTLYIFLSSFKMQNLNVMTNILTNGPDYAFGICDYGGIFIPLRMLPFIERHESTTVPMRITLVDDKSYPWRAYWIHKVGTTTEDASMDNSNHGIEEETLESLKEAQRLHREEKAQQLAATTKAAENTSIE